MQIIDTYKPFDIQEIELSEWKQRPVKHTFFELVFILEGKGTQCINYNEYDYHKGSIFLLPPLKCHSFNIGTPSKFVFLRFNDSFFKQINRGSIDRNAWFHEASYILSNYNQLPGDIIKTDTDRKHLENLLNIILQESKQYGNASITLIKSLMTSMLEILIRNIKQGSFYELSDKTIDDRITKMLSYINEHIHNPKALKVEHLANVFSMSSTYVSEYFKKAGKHAFT